MSSPAHVHSLANGKPLLELTSRSRFLHLNLSNFDTSGMFSAIMFQIVLSHFAILSWLNARRINGIDAAPEILTAIFNKSAPETRISWFALEEVLTHIF
jgi:hypothetical protein